MLAPLSTSHGSMSGAIQAATSMPTTLTASGTTFTKGNYSQLIASTGYEGCGIWVAAGPAALAMASINRHTLVDIGIGGAGSERVLIENLDFSCHRGARSWFFPLLVPRGSRISARAASATASQVVEMQVYVWRAGTAPLAYAGAACESYGTVLASCSGTTLATPGATNTRSGYQQLVASTTRAARYMVGQVGPETSNAFSAAGVGLVDFAVGAAGQERIILADVPCRWDTSENFDTEPIGIPVNLPAGARLSARWQGSGIADLITASVICVG